MFPDADGWSSPSQSCQTLGGDEQKEISWEFFTSFATLPCCSHGVGIIQACRWAFQVRFDESSDNSLLELNSDELLCHRINRDFGLFEANSNHENSKKEETALHMLFMSG